MATFGLHCRHRTCMRAVFCQLQGRGDMLTESSEPTLYHLLSSMGCMPVTGR